MRSKKNGESRSVSRRRLPFPVFGIASLALSVVGFVLVLLYVSSGVSERATAACQANVRLASEHLLRATENAERMLRGVSTWLRLNPQADFRTDKTLVALATVMNVDPNETFAFAVIDSSGSAWLLDEKFAGRPFDITDRPYFPAIASAEPGRISFGPRTTNANTGSDALPMFLKTQHAGQQITVSTAISANRIDAVLRDLTRSDN